MQDAYKKTAELGLLAVAFFFAVPGVPSTAEPYDAMPGLALAGVAYAGSLAFALYRKAETWPFAATKLLLFLIFGWVLHLRMTIH